MTSVQSLVKRMTTMFLAFALAVVFTPAVAWMAPAPQALAAENTAAAMETVTVTGTENYDEARKVLDIVNKERTALGLDPLELDDDLMETAMQRAAELSVLYSHTRPNGSDCFTAFPTGTTSFSGWGENIAIGYSSAAEVMEGWFYNERELYEAGERDLTKVGHYLNLINPDFKSIGIGCFEQGTFYWEQALSGEEATVNTTTGTKEASHRVIINYDICGKDQSFNKDGGLKGKTLNVGDTFEMQYDVTNDRWQYSYATLDPSSATWTSTDPSVCTVDDKGVVTAKGAGKATITATLLSGKILTHEWTVTDDAEAVMYRLYNPNSGEHFYTASTVERDATIAAGWDDEGIGWTAPKHSGTPVYRLYNPNYPGEHHYTMSAGERDILMGLGWVFESKDYNEDGAAWYSDDQKRVPLYREYNSNEFANNHNYTTDKGEHDSLLSLGWKDEGLAWYGVK